MPEKRTAFPARSDHYSTMAVDMREVFVANFGWVNGSMVAYALILGLLTMHLDP